MQVLDAARSGLHDPKVLHKKLAAIFIHQLLQKSSAWQRALLNAYSDCMANAAVQA